MATITDLVPTGTLTFHQALVQAEAQARSTLDVALHERLSCAVALVKHGAVFQEGDGHTWTVESTSKPGNEYRINGQGCQCADAHYRAQKRCKHALAVYLSQRVLSLMQQPPVPVGPEMVEPWADNDPEGAPPVVPQEPQEPAPAAPVPGIDPRHIVLIQGKPFVRFAGLLDLAHKRGLQTLQVTWTYNDAGLSLAQAVAVFPFGTFTECGDASPESVTKKVALHFRRVACTRAAARALRLALGVEVCSVEELGDE